MDSEQRKEMERRANETLNWSKRRPGIEDIMRGDKPSREKPIYKPEKKDSLNDFVLGGVVGAVITLILILCIQGLATWFGQNEIFANSFVSPLIIAIGALAGGIFKSKS